VKTGDIVKVKVLEVDVARKRISLTMKLDASSTGSGQARGPRRDAPRDNRYQGAQRGQRAPSNSNPQLNTAMAGAFAKLSQRK
ncbi:MAG TPA: S1 RNA-binding domain-containing protein, partial [Ramlibacter sp.]